MIRIGPWNRLALTVRWLKQEYKQEFSLCKQPPNHIPIVYGLIEMYNKPSGKSKSKLNDPSLTNEEIINSCFICKKEILKETLIGCKVAQILKCFKCEQISHTVCLAKHFIGEEKQLLPIDGNCPKCDQHLIWGKLFI
jgi:structure-specific endonuclease subunit SLX1